MSFPFELLSDAEESACKLFDVIKMKNMYGKKVRGIERSTFVIDAGGVVRREWRGVKVPGPRAGGARIRENPAISTVECSVFESAAPRRNDSDHSPLIAALIGRFMIQRKPASTSPVSLPPPPSCSCSTPTC